MEAIHHHDEKTMATTDEHDEYGTVRGNVAGIVHGGEQEHHKAPQIHAKTIILVLAVYLVYLAGGFKIVAAGAYGRQIGTVLGGADKSTWLVQILTIIIAVLSPPLSEAADLWGRKWLLVILTGSGVVGCIVTGTATSMGAALGGQVISGIACSSQPLCHAVPSEVIPRRFRPFAQAGVNISIAIASVVVLLAGGALTRNNNDDGFRVLFYINAGLFGVATVAIALLYNPLPREMQKTLTQKQKLARLDWIGFLLLSAGLTLVCMALVWSDNPYGWRNVHIIATFTIGCVLLISLVVYETRFKKNGMSHHALFKRGRNIGLAIGCIFVEGLVFFALNNYYAFEVSVLYEHDSLLVGLRYSICFIVFAVSTALTGLFCTTTKMLRYPIVVGFGSFVVLMICMATANLSSNAALWGYTVIFGSGIGILLNTLMTTAQLGTPPELIASASGLIISTRSVGGSVALAIYNAIFTHTLSTNLGTKVLKAVLPLGLPLSSIGPLIGLLISGTIDGLTHIPGITGPIIQAGGNAVLQSFVPAFRYVWVTAGCFAFVATIAAWFIVDPTNEFNANIDAPAESEEALYSREK